VYKQRIHIFLKTSFIINSRMQAVAKAAAQGAKVAAKAAKVAAVAAAKQSAKIAKASAQAAAKGAKVAAQAAAKGAKAAAQGAKAAAKTAGKGLRKVGSTALEVGIAVAPLAAQAMAARNPRPSGYPEYPGYPPAGNAPAGNAPAGNAPAGNAPAGNAPAGNSGNTTSNSMNKGSGSTRGKGSKGRGSKRSTKKVGSGSKASPPGAVPPDKSHLRAACPCAGILDKLYNAIHNNPRISKAQHWVEEAVLNNLIKAGKIPMCKCVDLTRLKRLEKTLELAKYTSIKNKDGIVIPFKESPAYKELNKLLVKYNGGRRSTVRHNKHTRKTRRKYHG